MRRILMVAAIGAFVLGGATVVAAQTEEDAAPERVGPIASAIQEVLDDLVEDGTLTQGQADAVTEALATRREEAREEREARRRQLEEFWSDGELTQEEIDQLPDPNFWDRFSEALEDGVVERDELPRGRFHFHWGPGRGGPAVDQGETTS